uniref:F-box domain-containing protein n=1 Tax=Oryza meridionalis TaxID=40149 RepID=A0A0E0E9I3_9ORYZ
MGITTRARGKRRKLQGHQTPPPPPPCGAAQISLLPDDALREIVTRLPSNDAARTQLLSSRWRHLWRSAPLNLDLRDAGDISRVLATHPGPARRFAVPDLGSSFPNRRATLDAWFAAPALDNLQELELMGSYRPLPPSAARLFPTLRVAVFSRCSFPDDPAAAAFCFPRLEQLTLEYVAVSEATLHGVLAGCAALDCLLLRGVRGCRRLSISSPTIRVVGVCVTRALKELIVEDAPRLERLLMPEVWQLLRVSVISAPKLEALGWLSNHCTLEIGTIAIKCSIGEFHFDSLTTVARGVKVLALDIDNLSLDMAIDFMRCFPSLEKLYIRKFSHKCNNVWHQKMRHKMLDPIECLDLNLKKVEVSGYCGNKSHIDFAMFFVLNGRVLELMRLECGTRRNDRKWIENQKMCLKLDNMVSKDAEFHFTRRTSWNYFTNVRRAHELLIADPFCT